MPIFATLLIILFSLLVTLFFVLYLTARHKKMLIFICSIFVVFGFLMYTAAYMSTGVGVGNAFYAAFRGILSSIRMLFVADDFWTIRSLEGIEWLTENLYFQLFFWLSHVAALIIMQTALISIFGQRLIDRFRILFGFYRDVYVIRGCSDNALCLGESISISSNNAISSVESTDVPRKPTKKKPDARKLIIFLLEEDDNIEGITKRAARFSGIVRVMNQKNDFEANLKKIGFKRRLRRKKEFHFILMPDDIYATDEVKCIVEHAKKERIDSDKLDIFIFVPSEWDRIEIENITQQMDSDKKAYDFTFHIINEVDLVTRQMVLERPPYKCGIYKCCTHETKMSAMNEERNSKDLVFCKGAANRPFSAMVLGFDLVGQNALLHLVRNGQFLVEGDSNAKMRAIVIDKNITKSESCFLERYPGLELCCDMHFRNYDVLCKPFHKLLKNSLDRDSTDETSDSDVLDIITNLDYIVVALGDDNLNKQVALDIRRIYKQKTSKYPVIAVSQRHGRSKKLDDGNIFCFGMNETLYKESLIIREDADKVAKAVNSTYGGKPWHELDWFTQESNRAVADFIPAMLFIARITEEDAKKRDKLVINDSGLKENLTHTEKLRWNAFHATMGFRRMEIDTMEERFNSFENKEDREARLNYCRRDTNDRLHACFVTWEELDEVTTEYNRLEVEAGCDKDKVRNFKASDFNNIENIPKFLNAPIKNDYK